MTSTPSLPLLADAPRARHAAMALAVALAVALPWVAPWVWGPSVSVIQTLVACACAAIVLALAPPPSRRVGAVLAVAALLCGYVMWRAPSANTAAGVFAALWLFGAGAAVASGDGRSWAAVRDGWVLAALLSAAAGLVQFAGWSTTFAGWVSPSTGDVFGNLRQRNQFATLMAIGIACAFFARDGRVLRLPSWIAIAVLAVFEALSSSRTGGLLLLALCLVHWPWRPVAGAEPHARRDVLVAAGAYGATALMQFVGTIGATGPGVFGRLVDSEACQSRAVLWSNVLELIAQRPLAGWGWAQLDRAHLLASYDGARFCDILDNAHDLPLHLAVELGLPVAATVLALAAIAVLRARPWADNDPARRLAWTVIGLIGLHSLLEYPLWYAPFQAALGFACGAALARRPAAARSSGAAARAAIACVALGVTAWAGWSYWRVGQNFVPASQRAAAYREDTLWRTRDAWLFDDQRAFAELVVVPLTPANACHVHSLASRLLAFSPEPRVIERLIDSARMTGRADEAALLQARYAAAFPAAHEAWAAQPPPDATVQCPG